MKKSAEKCRFLLNKGGESVNIFNYPNDMFIPKYYIIYFYINTI